jgi:hypothetical protein
MTAMPPCSLPPICVQFTSKIITTKAKKAQKERERRVFLSKTLFACELKVRFAFAVKKS